MSERGELSLPPRRYSRSWLAFGRLVERTAALLGGRAFYRRWFLGPGRFRVREERVEVPGLPPGLQGFRIAQLSDFHAGRFLGEGDLRHVVEELRRGQPHLVVLTGDYITGHWREALGLLSDLSELSAEHGVLAVFGNHDYRGRDEHRIAAAFEELGVRVLRNECVRIDTGAGVLAVVGLEDLEEAKHVDLETARADLVEGDFELVLCHNPHMAERLARPGCVAVLSGHTHGNQIDLPGFRSFGPPHSGDRREFDRTVALTTYGVGVIGLPFRFRAPAELLRLTLVPSDG